MINVTPQAETPVAVLVDECTLLLYGWVDRPLPALGTVLFEGHGEGTFDALYWPKANGPTGAHSFVAVLRFPELERFRPGRIVLTGTDAEARYVLPVLQNIKVNPLVLVATLREDMPEALPGVFDLLRRVLSPADGKPPAERVARFLATFLHTIAQQDGFGEIFGRMRGSGLLIQGWAFSLVAGSQDLVIETQAWQVHNALVSSFERADLPVGARGAVAMLPAADLDPASIRRVYYRSVKGWCYLELFESRTLLPDGIALAHLRDVLPNLQGDPVLLQSLRRIATSQFEGFETVSRLEVPVCAALDIAVRVPGAGTYLAGWLLDPDERVTSVTLRGGGLDVRLDSHWCRTARRDISEGFGQDARFAGRLIPGRDAHGFIVFAPEPENSAPDAERYLQLTLADETCAFVPVKPIPAATTVVRRLLSSFDLNDPATDMIIARHVGPIVQAAGRRPDMGSRSGSTPAGTSHMLGRPLPTPRISVILPVVDGREDIDINLAKFAVDPDFAEAEIIVVAGAGSHPGLARAVRRFADFYRLAVRLVIAAGVHDLYEAMDAGAEVAGAELLVFLSPSILPTAPGWLGELEWAYLRSGRTGMVSPTLLYEDNSIKFAGVRAHADRPGGGHGLVSQFAGYPRDWLKGRDLTEVPLGTVDCCVMPRQLYRDLGGFGRDYVGIEFKGLDFCLKLRAAGHACLWLPTVALIAVDEQPRDQAPDYWQQTGALVDRWGFDRKWSLHLANLSAARGIDR
jgi:GT2 family glycosyltransferase